MDNDRPKTKPIGRELNLNPKEDKIQGIPPAIAALLVIGVGVIAFVAGTRADEYQLINNIFDSDKTISEELPTDLDYSSVEVVYDKLKRNYDGELSVDIILDGIKKGLAESTGDPYTVYLPPEQASQFKDDLNGTFSGIGAEIGKEGDFVIIVAPLKGFPAETAGLRAQDIVLKINGEDAVGWSVEEAVLAIRGEKGTDVTLEILRNGERLELSITRDTIVVPSVEYEITQNIGVLHLYRFAEDTTKLVDEAAREFLDEKVEGIVLDLRNNSGGYLTAAVDIASYWVDNKVIVEQREDGGNRVTDSLKSRPGALLGGIPTVVLVNKGSASASEIVAGALADYKLATLIGEATFGKGSVQSLEDLPGGGVLKVTIARWYTPNGTNIDGDGLEPELEVPFELVEDDLDADNQLDAAIKFLQN